MSLKTNPETINNFNARQEQSASYLPFYLFNSSVSLGSSVYLRLPFFPVSPRQSLCFSVDFLKRKSLLWSSFRLSLPRICSILSVCSLPLKMAFTQSERENELGERPGLTWCSQTKQASRKRTVRMHVHVSPWLPSFKGAW